MFFCIFLTEISFFFYNLRLKGLMNVFWIHFTIVTSSPRDKDSYFVGSPIKPKPCSESSYCSVYVVYRKNSLNVCYSFDVCMHVHSFLWVSIGFEIAYSECLPKDCSMSFQRQQPSFAQMNDIVQYSIYSHRVALANRSFPTKQTDSHSEKKQNGSTRQWKPDGQEIHQELRVTDYVAPLSVFLHCKEATVVFKIYSKPTATKPNPG